MFTDRDSMKTKNDIGISYVEHLNVINNIYLQPSNKLVICICYMLVYMYVENAEL